jgi:hypothetical protein
MFRVSNNSTCSQLHYYLFRHFYLKTEEWQYFYTACGGDSLQVWRLVWTDHKGDWAGSNYSHLLLLLDRLTV